MPRPRGNAKKHAERMKAAILPLWAEGRLEREIAETVGIGVSGVSYWITKLNREAQAVIADKTAEKARQLVALKRVESEAWAAWRRSQQPSVTKLSEATTGAEEKTREQHREQGQTGDPSYLAQVRGALADQRDLLGLNAAKKVDVRALARELGEMPDEELESLATGAVQ